MSENPFAGATRDPIALLEQLITRVGALQRDIDQVKTEVAGVRTDVAEVRTELKAHIAEVRTDLSAEIAQVRTELKADIAQVRTELKADIAQVREEMAELRLDLKADIAETRHELKSDIAHLRTAVTSVRDEALTLIKLTDREHQLVREQLGASLEVKTGLTRTELKGLYSDLERRVADLEAAERRRREPEGT